ncbi:MAG: hypothetical protein ABEI52_11705 [Halobacteriaceae archaeon]
MAEAVDTQDPVDAPVAEEFVDEWEREWSFDVPNEGLTIESTSVS